MRELSISAFAAACGLSVSAVRRYGDAGLLAPAHVDERTGYRWYEPAQVADGVLVRTLRELDVPVAEVAAILALDDPQAQLAASTRTGTTSRRRYAAAAPSATTSRGSWGAGRS